MANQAWIRFWANRPWRFCGERWLTLFEFGALYCISRKRILGSIRRGELRTISIGNAVRVLDPGPRAAAILFDRERRLRLLPVLNTAEAAVILGITPRAVRKNATKGRLQSAIVGQRRLYAIEDIGTFIANRGL